MNRLFRVLVSVCLVAGASAAPESNPSVRPVRVVQRFDSEWVMKANELLDAQRLEGRVLEDVAAELAGYGAKAIQAYFAILAGTVDGPTKEGARRPAADALDPNEVLLAALARMNPTDVAVHVAVAAADADLDVRIVALRVLESVGADGAMSAWIDITERIETVHFERAYVAGPLEGSLAAVLARDPSGFTGLAARFEKLDTKLVPTVLRAVAASRRSQGLPFLMHLLGRRSERDLVLIPSIARLVEETSGDLSEEDLTWLRPFALDEDWRIRREALLALGRVGDWKSHATLVAALSDTQRLVQQAAYWSLARLSKADFGYDAAAWSAWFEAEIAWYEAQASRCMSSIESADPVAILDGAREFAAHELFRHDAARAVSQACTFSDAEIAKQVCRVLSNLASPAGCQGLLEALASEDASVREAARDSLAAITRLEIEPDATAWRRALHGA